MKNKTQIKGIIDRIEDGFAVILLGDDEEVMVELPDCYLPEGLEEGDIINFKLIPKSKKTKEAKQKVAGMIEKLKS